MALWMLELTADGVSAIPSGSKGTFTAAARSVAGATIPPRRCVAVGRCRTSEIYRTDLGGIRPWNCQRELVRRYVRDYTCRI